MRLHELPQTIPGQNAFFQFLFGFANGAGDALTMAIELNQQIPPQHQGLIFGRLVPNFIRLQIVFQIDRLGNLHKNPAGIFKKGKQTSDPAGLVFRTQH